MIRIPASFDQPIHDLGVIGRVGEGNVRAIAFDCGPVLPLFPDGELICVIQRPGDLSPDVITPSPAEKGIFLVPLRAHECAKAGNLRMEFRLLRENSVLKSAIFYGRIVTAIWGENDIPGQPMHDALNRVESTLKEAKETSKELSSALEEAQEKIEEMDKIIAGGGGGGGGGVAFTTDETLSLKNGVLSVNCANDIEKDNTLPITAAAVFTGVGNIHALLQTI